MKKKPNAKGKTAVRSSDLLADLRKNHTGLNPCCVEDEPDAHVVWIRVGVQTFRIDGYSDTKPEAEWMRDMLAKLMLNLVTMYSANDKLTDGEAASRSVQRFVVPPKDQ